MAPRMRAVSIYTSVAPNKRDLAPELIAEILDYPGPYQSDAEKAACRKLVEQFTPEDQEVIARTSYVYWLVTVIHGEEASEELRVRTAMKEARRHLEKRSFERASASLRSCCQYRKEWKVDLLRLCFTNQFRAIVDSLSEEDRAFLRRAEDLVEAEMRRNPMVIRGYDRQNRPMVHRSYPRQRPSGKEALEQYILGVIYIMERTFACTEILNKGRQDKVIAVADFSGYKASVANPIGLTVESAKILRKNYPNRAHKVFILDPPVFMRGFYAILSPFIASETKEKLKFVTGEKQKRKMFGSSIDPEQSPSCMNPEGKLSDEFDSVEMLYSVPFYALYDEHC